MADALAVQPYSHDQACWQAVLHRDPAAEGAFYYAVRTTGVYCRPTCPSRLPKRENVVFFDSPDAARRAGFRPCLKCQPDGVSAQRQTVQRVRQILDTAERAPTLAELGRAVGLSPFHLQRLFKRLTGLTPRQYVLARRAERLKARLRDGAKVVEAMYDAGYGSSRALYQAADRHLGMRPSAYKHGGRGERITYTIVDSPLGRMLLAATERGICALRFGQDQAMVQELRKEFPLAHIVHHQEPLSSYVEAVLAHLEGRQARLDLPLDLKATAFQERVWAALREIPYGETRTYRQVAERLGMPGAARAVARACATNPVAVVVPCHRVVGSNGQLRGYRWGLERKGKLLEREKRGQAGAAPEAASG